MSSGEESLTFNRERSRSKTMDALKNSGKDLEMDSLVHSEPVKILIVLGYMRTRV